MDSLNNPKSALKRLNRDHINFLKQKKCFRFCSIYQDPNNGLNFHANFFHKELKVIHFIMKFPLNYPFSPPKIDLYGYIKHDNLLYYNNPYTLPFISTFMDKLLLIARKKSLITGELSYNFT